MPTDKYATLDGMLEALQEKGKHDSAELESNLHEDLLPYVEKWTQDIQAIVEFLDA